MAARIFISYSRKDGVTFAADLRKRLTKKKFAIWQDIVSLEGGRDWWSQIEDVLKARTLDHVVLVITPEALNSEVMRREIRLARQEGKTVSPIRGPGLVDLNALPRWLGQVYDLDLPEQWNKLIEVLTGPSRQKRMPMMAPAPPTDFVARPREFEILKRRLLDSKGDAVAISAALTGAGGYGKTTLAKALAHDDAIQDAYFDGVLWVELGEAPGNLLDTLSDLITRLSGAPPELKTVNAAASALGEALGDRRILLVIDDVWREQDLRPFLQGGTATTRLMTTRLNRVLPAATFRQPVDAMRASEAHELLSTGLPEDHARALSKELNDLAGRLGKWAQLLKLVNGFLRERVIDGGEPLHVAVADADARLTEEGLDTFSADDEADRTKAVARTINLSLGLLDPAQRARFAELAVFPEDTVIPIGVVARLWCMTAGLSERATKDLLGKFYGLSLLLAFDLNLRTLRFHDTIRHFLQDQAGADGVVAGHRRLVAALDGVATDADSDAPSRKYYYLHLPDHLAAAGKREQLDKLLLDPGWLQAKLDATSPQVLVADYERHGAGQAQNLVGRTLRLTTGICARDQRQLLPQLVGRLMACSDPAARTFLDRARSLIKRPAVLPTCPSLNRPGPEIRRLFDPEVPDIGALVQLPDGRLASGSISGEISIWDLTRGTVVARLKGHAWGSINALVVLPDGRLLSGSNDKTILLWDINSGAVIRRFADHEAEISALAAIGDDRFASGSTDGVVYVWDLKAGTKVCAFAGSARSASQNVKMAFLRDGLLAFSHDNQIILWDLNGGTETRRLAFESSWYGSLMSLDSGALAAAGEGGVQIWDMATQTLTARLRHEAAVYRIAEQPDGRIATGDSVGTIRIWDLDSGTEKFSRRSHAGWVTAMASLSNGGLATSGRDDTIIVWNFETDESIDSISVHLASHDGPVNALSVLPFGRVVSAGDDGTVRLWDMNGDANPVYIDARVVGWGTKIDALAIIPNNRLASAVNFPSSIKIWNLESLLSDQEIKTQHEEFASLIMLPDGRLASGCHNTGLIRLWDIESGREQSVLQGPSGSVFALASLSNAELASSHGSGPIVLWDLTIRTIRAHLVDRESPRGYRAAQSLALIPENFLLASGDSDGVIRLWNIQTGAVAHRLEGHEGIVNSVIFWNGRLASAGSDDKTIRVWSLNTLEQMSGLDVDGAVLCLAGLPDGRLVAGDALGRVHWLEIVD